MTTILLVVIYIAFISLGLPDSLLGSAWPLMYGEFHAPVSYAGIISMIIAGGTIFSSLFSDRLIRRLGTGVVTSISVAMTAVALFGFSVSSTFWHVCLWAIPYGLGAGSVDAALNNFVALHYQSKHMSWLHCFWGIGATLGPAIMGMCLTGGLRWNGGYFSVGIIQSVLVVFLVLSLPLWKRHNTATETTSQEQTALSLRQVIQLPKAKTLLSAFFCYCCLESTAGLWASSYLVLHKGIAADMAAKWAALFYLGITIGRFFSGFVSDRLGDRQMVRIGQCIVGVGILLVLFSMGTLPSLAGLIFIGLGCAPIYPSLLHATPTHFGAECSQSIMGMQMAAAYVGSTLAPPVFGFLAEQTDIRIYPFYLVIFIVIMFIMTERANKNHGIH